MSYSKRLGDCTVYFKDPQCRIIHRLDGPAAVYDNGSVEWYRNGKPHREDGPAIENTSTSASLIVREWYYNGENHREDGLAVEYADGMLSWYRHGFYHRLDGPAVMRNSSLGETAHYYVNGNLCELDEFPKAVANWVSVIEVTTEDVKRAIGDYRIVEW